MANSGYIQLRRGLSEHVRDGRLSFSEASLYVFMIMDTNPNTGVCFGSAGLFAAIYGISSRTCRECLENLEKKGYIRRFPIRGKHGSYPILINKFMCSIGAMKGKYVNISKSSSCNNIYYENCDDSVDESVNDDVNESVNDIAGSKRLETRDKKKTEQVHEEIKSKPVKKENSIVDEIYKAYPRHDAPKDAKKAITKALNEIAPDRDGNWLLERTEIYAKQRRAITDKDPSAKQFTPLPATWFNRGSYDAGDL